MTDKIIPLQSDYTTGLIAQMESVVSKKVTEQEIQEVQQHIVNMVHFKQSISLRKNTTQRIQAEIELCMRWVKMHQDLKTIKHILQEFRICKRRKKLAA